MKPKKRRSFQDKLNKADKAHFADMTDHGRVTLAALREALAYQREKGVVCRECNAIARKLGVLPD